ncbi:MAG: hypothetical protein CFH19_00470 [Alphaproteobacteria bacterium MarineAlpha5_Bin9]|nr:MAG: hypothetical protein CFH19_00470 [Alphaproteobacteria bacterium MarineAlpha5_Bin9]|tara:strand:+ start:6507 stop:7094 length:588 start_codon:yes stop_codon:yes gene_type:complete
MTYNEILLSFSNWVELNYFLSMFLFFIFIYLYSAISLPGLLVFIVFSGYAFGSFIGYFLTILSISFGSHLFFLLSKHFFKNYIYMKFEKYLSKINLLIKKSSLEYLIIFRMIPGTPLAVQNFILSTLDISSYKFILSTIIGFTPIVLFSTLLGNKINNLSQINSLKVNNIFTLDLLLIIFIIISLLCFKIFYKKK